MARLNDERGLRLFRAVKTHELRLRNWSIPGEWLFAIYTRDDSYVGCVQLNESNNTLTVCDPTKTARRERLILEGLCRTYNSREASS